MDKRAQGALLAVLLGLLALFSYKAIEEYAYYQQLKKEHQELFLAEIGRTPDGRVFTRKMFLDALLEQAARGQKKKD